MKLKEIPRTATFAWSPESKTPTVVTGTASGTIDANFNAAAELNLWNFDLLDHSVASFSGSPVARVETDARFYDVAFSHDGKFVVGAFENGVVEAWKSPSLQSVGKNDSAHSGVVKSVAFSNKDVSKFATGGSQGEVFVWDVNNLSQPFAPGTIATQRHDDVESVAWNNITSHILASGGNKGFASIWDTRRKREVLHLHYTSAAGLRVPISSVQWHPTNSTKLATASLDDNEPVICIWDLKNVNSPEKVLRGHTKGVLSLDWCRQDENLLLSGGRDNSTILWNPVSGEQLGSYPISVEWAFKTQFHPRLPDLFGSASFDGKISIQTLQDTNVAQNNDTSTQVSGGDADFWESENVMDAVHPNFKLQQPPKWLISPTSVKFGFGGKLVITSKDNVEIKSVKDSALDDDVIKGFSSAIKSQDFKDLAAQKSDGSLSWKLLSGLIANKEVDIPDGLLSKDEENSGDKVEEDDDDDDLFNFVPQYAPNLPLNLLSSKHPKVAAAILANDFDTAVSKLIAAGEAGDALLVATYGDPGLVARAQNAYMIAHGDDRAYLRAAWAVSQKHHTDLIENSELKAWPLLLKSALDTSDSKLITHKLGLRLVEAGQRDDALRVYFAGKNVGAAAALWLDELPQIEKKIAAEGNVTPFIAHVKALQQVVEKITVITHKLGVPPVSDPGADRLYSALRDYADISSQQGDLDLAKLLLDMLPDEYAADKQRVDVAVEKPLLPKHKGTPLRHNPNVSQYDSAPKFYTGTTGASAPHHNSFNGETASTDNTRAAATPGPLPGSSTGRPSAVRSGGYSNPTVPKTGYRPNPYAPAGISIAAASMSSPIYDNPPSAKATPPPPPPPSSVVGGSAKQTSTATPYKGWNDVPELSNSARRTPAAPTRVAAKSAAAGAPPASNSSSPRGSVSTPPGPPRAGAIPSTSSGNPPVAPPPAPRAANPYAPKNSSSRASPALTKNNPYAPAVGSTSFAVPNPLAAPSPASRQVSRAAPPPSTSRAVNRSPVNGAFMPPPDSIIPPPIRSSTASPISPPPMGSAKPKVAPPPPANATGTTTSGVTASSSEAHGSPAAKSSPAAHTSSSNQLNETTRPIQTSFQAELERVRPILETQHAKLYKDTVKRLGKLYDSLPNLSDSVVSRLTEISGAISLKDYHTAHDSLQQIVANHSDETGDWLAGVKRLVKISEGVPV